MDDRNELAETGDEPVSGRLRRRDSRAAQTDQPTSAPPGTTASASSYGWRGHGPNAWPERVLIVRLPIAAPPHLDFDTTGAASAAPLPLPREAAPLSWRDRLDVNGQTFDEAMREAFGANHPHAATLQAMDDFLQTDFVILRMDREGIIVAHDGLELRASLRSVQRIAEQQSRARFQQAEARRREAGGTHPPPPPAGEDERRGTMREMLGGRGMLEPGDDAEEGVDGDEGEEGDAADGTSQQV